MLAKDYRTRISLDAIVVDDWVTFEGSEPLFEDDEYMDTTTDEIFTQFNSDFPSPPSPRIGIAAASSVSSGSLSISQDGPPHAAKKILIVDDSLVVRKMLAQQINSVKLAACVLASTGEEGIEECRKAIHHHNDCFDLVFCDLLMPGMNGDEMVKRVRDMGYDGKIIGMTASERSTSGFYESGADEVIRKPIGDRDIERLLSNEFKLAVSQSEKMGRTQSASSSWREEVEKAITECNVVDIGIVESVKSSNNSSHMSISSIHSSPIGDSKDPLDVSI